MKTFKILSLAVLALAFLSSCASVQVATDYDTKVDFQTYNSYAFYKTGIDKAQISDLDKKRILSAIEQEMNRLGYVKSDNPDILVSIFTKEREQVDVYNNNFGFGWGWGWGWGWGGFANPWLWGPGWGGGWGPNVSTRTQGSLFIDLIDTKTKGLVWQGRGVGTLNATKSIEKKEERIKEFVSQIMSTYPPGGSGL